jgi:hypothetical protein
MKNVWIWFRSLSRFGQIGVFVLLTHAAFLLMLLINHAWTVRPPLKKSIAIRTTLSPRPSAIKKMVGAPTPKAEPRLKETKSTPSPKAKPKEIKERKQDHQASGIDHNLLQQMADSLEAISAPKPTLKPSHLPLSLPPSIEIQKQDQATFDRPGYGETVSAILQSSLDLPEFGQVVAKIEIDASGAVIQCDILDARSKKNAEFLKKRLRELAFPCFNEFGLSENKLIFTITFHNAENR